MTENPLTPRFQMRLDWYRAHGFSFTISRGEGECFIELENKVINRWEKFTFQSEQDMEEWNLGKSMNAIQGVKHEWRQATHMIEFYVPGQSRPSPQPVDEPVDNPPRRKIEP